MAKIESGRYDKPITVQFPVTTNSAAGESVVWTTSPSNIPTFASIDPLGGSETAIAAKVSGNEIFEIKTRYYSTVTTKCRIKWGSRYFTIKSLDVPTKRRHKGKWTPERNQELVMMANEVEDNA